MMYARKYEDYVDYEKYHLYEDNAVDFFFDGYPPTNIGDIAPYYNRKLDEEIDAYIDESIADGDTIDRIVCDGFADVTQDVWERFCNEDYRFFDTTYSDGTPDPMPEPIWDAEKTDTVD